MHASMHAQVRCIARLAPGDEITFSYVDLGLSYDGLRAELLRRYVLYVQCTYVRVHMYVLGAGDMLGRRSR